MFKWERLFQNSMNAYWIIYIERKQLMDVDNTEARYI